MESVTLPSRRPFKRTDHQNQGLVNKAISVNSSILDHPSWQNPMEITTPARFGIDTSAWYNEFPFSLSLVRAYENRPSKFNPNGVPKSSLLPQARSATGDFPPTLPNLDSQKKAGDLNPPRDDEPDDDTSPPGQKPPPTEREKSLLREKVGYEQKTDTAINTTKGIGIGSLIGGAVAGLGALAAAPFTGGASLAGIGGAVAAGAAAGAAIEGGSELAIGITANTAQSRKLDQSLAEGDSLETAYERAYGAKTSTEAIGRAVKAVGETVSSGVSVYKGYKKGLEVGGESEYASTASGSRRGSFMGSEGVPAASGSNRVAVLRRASLPPQFEEYVESPVKTLSIKAKGLSGSRSRRVSVETIDSSTASGSRRGSFAESDVEGAEVTRRASLPPKPVKTLSEKARGKLPLYQGLSTPSPRKKGVAAPTSRPAETPYTVQLPGGFPPSPRTPYQNIVSTGYGGSRSSKPVLSPNLPSTPTRRFMPPTPESGSSMYVTPRAETKNKPAPPPTPASAYGTPRFRPPPRGSGFLTRTPYRHQLLKASPEPARVPVARRLDYPEKAPFNRRLGYTDLSFQTAGLPHTFSGTTDSSLGEEFLPRSQLSSERSREWEGWLDWREPSQVIEASSSSSSQRTAAPLSISSHQTDSDYLASTPRRRSSTLTSAINTPVPGGRKDSLSSSGSTESDVFFSPTEAIGRSTPSLRKTPTLSKRNVSQESGPFDNTSDWSIPSEEYTVADIESARIKYMDEIMAEARKANQQDPHGVASHFLERMQSERELESGGSPGPLTVIARNNKQIASLEKKIQNADVMIKELKAVESTLKKVAKTPSPRTSSQTSVPSPSPSVRAAGKGKRLAGTPQQIMRQLPPKAVPSKALPPKTMPPKAVPATKRITRSQAKSAARIPSPVAGPSTRSSTSSAHPTLLETNRYLGSLPLRESVPGEAFSVRHMPPQKKLKKEWQPWVVRRNADLDGRQIYADVGRVQRHTIMSRSAEIYRREYFRRTGLQPMVDDPILVRLNRVNSKVDKESVKHFFEKPRKE